jgi:hypothetical protein
MRVALVCISKNEDNYIDEWIKYHLKLGFDDIFVCNNDWDFNYDNPNVHITPFNGWQKSEFEIKVNKGRADSDEMRNLSDFDNNNHNDIVDTLALDFMKN